MVHVGDAGLWVPSVSKFEVRRTCRSEDIAHVVLINLVTLIFDLETDVQVACEMGYRRSNFGLPMPFSSRVIRYVHDRQTDRQK